MEKVFCVYMVTNLNNTVIYIGITTNLPGRTWQHKHGVVEGLTTRYKLSKLVYYEICPSAESAIIREKQLKGGSRAKKVALIRGLNPTWKGQSDEL